MKHLIIYVPGLGDTTASGRKFAIRLWKIYGISAVVHQLYWADKEHFAPKLATLLSHIDESAAKGYRVSLVGESAGASAVMHAYAARHSTVHRVAHICGKLQGGESVHPSTYSRNPAFAESMALLPSSIATLGRSHLLGRVLSVRPLVDKSVPLPDTIIAGIQTRTIPTVGHMASIALGITVFSWFLVGFLKKR